MQIFLDCQPKKIIEYTKKYNYEFGQLITPLTNSPCANVTYGIDNGAFTKFNKKGWKKLIDNAAHEQQILKPKFVACPDIVGNGKRTLELYNHFWGLCKGLPRALVLQDGMEDLDIPWAKMEAVFVGGTNSFKLSDAVIDLCKTAKMLDKWVHVGRVNTPKRIYHFAQDWFDLVDSIDGSGISRFDHMLEKILPAVLNVKNKKEIKKPVDLFEDK